MFYAEEYPKEHWETDLTKDLERVLVIHRLREVTALVGYTRFDFVPSMMPATPTSGVTCRVRPAMGAS